MTVKEFITILQKVDGDTKVIGKAEWSDYDIEAIHIVKGEIVISDTEFTDGDIFWTTEENEAYWRSGREEPPEFMVKYLEGKEKK